MMDLRAVHRYTRALFQLAEQQSVLDQIDDQILAIKELVEKHHEIPHLLSNSTITLAEKEDFMGKIVPANTLPLLVNFLKVLIRKKRFKELPAMQQEFHRLYERKKRVEEVVVVSAVPLSEQNTAKLESALTKKFNYNVRLLPKVDPKMIGGLILRFGGQEINGSFRSRLDALRQLLMA